MLQKYVQVQGLQPCSETFFFTNTRSLLPVTPKYKLDEYFPDLETALRTLLCLPVPVVFLKFISFSLKELKATFKHPRGRRCYQ
jgi:hypothetical protein